MNYQQATKVKPDRYAKYLQYEEFRGVKKQPTTLKFNKKKVEAVGIMVANLILLGFALLGALK